MAEEKKISKAQQKAVHRYVKNNYDRVELTVPKGKKVIIKQIAKQNGESLNGFINIAINERIERLERNVAQTNSVEQTALPMQEETI